MLAPFPLAQAAAAQLGMPLQVVKKRRPKGFQVLPSRWVIERTFAWLGNFRRLSKDDERTTKSAEAFIWMAGSLILLRRLARSP